MKRKYVQYAKKQKNGIYWVEEPPRWRYTPLITKGDSFMGWLNKLLRKQSAPTPQEIRNQFKDVLLNQEARLAFADLDHACTEAEDSQDIVVIIRPAKEIWGGKE